MFFEGLRRDIQGRVARFGHEWLNIGYPKYLEQTIKAPEQAANEQLAGLLGRLVTKYPEDAARLVRLARQSPQDIDWLIEQDLILRDDIFEVERGTELYVGRTAVKQLVE